MTLFAPRRTQFSILQLVQSPDPAVLRPTDFESMEDMHDFARLAASSSDSISDAGYSFSSRNSTSSTLHSFHSPILRSTSFQSNSEFHSDLRLPPPPYLPKRKEKRSRSKQGHSIDYHRPDDKAHQQLPPKLPARAKSYNRSSCAFRHSLKKTKPARLAAVNEYVSAQQSTSWNVSHSSSPFSSPPSTPRTPFVASNTSRHTDSHTRRKSLDLGPSMMQAGIQRLKRSSSMWTIGDKSLAPSTAATRERHIQNLRAEPQLTEQQKFVVLKRARKIVQVFGSEAPTELVQGLDCPRQPSTPEHRDSLSTIMSAEVPPSSYDKAEPTSRPLSDIVLSDSSNLPSPNSPTSTASAMFRERRRRAAKLTQFFGVNYQDMPQSINESSFVVPSTPKHAVQIVDLDAPVVEVDVKVAGRRFWGLADGEMKNADVVDVLDKLRGLKAS
ncbi:hypothetical protein DXG03_007869 [Asterophora parasitica]|uniref:Uncharacterized protein n=1 Tax=Asterophora parasitica TaxID=117018 RepID=A0A9P7GCF8_9AGAR|nr:hypothetical protein DXG03_007869 [Asterophora parasitica]